MKKYLLLASFCLALSAYSNEETKKKLYARVGTFKLEGERKDQQKLKKREAHQKLKRRCNKKTKDKSGYEFTAHARDRMKERHVTKKQVKNTIRYTIKSGNKKIENNDIVYQLNGIKVIVAKNKVSSAPARIITVIADKPYARSEYFKRKKAKPIVDILREKKQIRQGLIISSNQ